MGSVCQVRTVVVLSGSHRDDASLGVIGSKSNKGGRLRRGGATSLSSRLCSYAAAWLLAGSLREREIQIQP